MTDNATKISEFSSFISPHRRLEVLRRERERALPLGHEAVVRRPPPPAEDVHLVERALRAYGCRHVVDLARPA